MINNEELNQIKQIPILKKILEIIQSQEKENTILKREITKINKVLNGDFNKTLEKIISERVDKIINTLKNKPSFQSLN